MRRKEAYIPIFIEHGKVMLIQNGIDNDNANIHTIYSNNSFPIVPTEGCLPIVRSALYLAPPKQDHHHMGN